VNVAWGKAVDPAAVADELQSGHFDFVACVHVETSTGVVNPIRDVGALARHHDVLFVVDAVTSIGAMPFNAAADYVDAGYTCSQKGLGCPPGLSPMTIGARALDRLKARKTPVQSFYLDLQLLDTFYTGHKYHHTASATMFYALREGLAIVAEEGLEARWARHKANHEAFVAGIEAMGLSMLVPEGHRLWTLNTPRIPEGVDDAKVRAFLLEKYSMEIAGGFGPLAGKVFRIGTMGYSSTAENVQLILEALAAALKAVEQARSYSRASGFTSCDRQTCGTTAAIRAASICSCAGLA
jgi:alanine-glyoxylate transaminase/serine-glyoxylate transaminase/serine-pyruvate transaminase